jgi:hypothetical protein
LNRFSRHCGPRSRGLQKMQARGDGRATARKSLIFHPLNDGGGI